MNKVLQTYLKIVAAFAKTGVTVEVKYQNFKYKGFYYMFIRITEGEKALDLDINSDSVTYWDSETAKDCNDEHYIPIEELDAWLKTFED